jgi:hypothetical protein
MKSQNMKNSHRGTKFQTHQNMLEITYN